MSRVLHRGEQPTLREMKLRPAGTPSGFLARVLLYGTVGGIAMWLLVCVSRLTSYGCDTFELLRVPGGNGMIITAHMTVCTIIGTSVVTKVYVHKENERDSGSSLILQYNGDEPVAAWTSSHTIAISAKNVWQVDRKLSAWEGVAIAYDLSGPVHDHRHGTMQPVSPAEGRR